MRDVKQTRDANLVLESLTPFCGINFANIDQLSQHLSQLFHLDVYMLSPHERKGYCKNSQSITSRICSHKFQPGAYRIERSVFFVMPSK